MTKSGTAYKFGDVILAEVPFTDSAQVKLRPAMVLFEELDNVIVAGITSNQNMHGIPVSRQEGMIADSVIKVNYIFTVSKQRIRKLIVTLSDEKKETVRQEIRKRMDL